jgi:lipoprotein-anchoring transpeptidase ErfK/SrfK
MRAAHSRRFGVVVVALLGLAGLTGCATTTVAGSGSLAPTGAASTRGVASPTLPTSANTPTAPSSAVATPVHVGSLESDGYTYGVGMPIIVWFNQKITDPSSFLAAASVTVNGAPAQGAWFFEVSSHTGQVIEAHYRPQTFWPGHAKIFVNVPVKGQSAGPGLAYDNNLTLDFATGVANVLTVDGATHKLTVTADGKLYGTYPVSLGATKSPTMLGTKVISAKALNERMVGSGYDEVVPYSMRITASGEYLHAAAWNVANIGKNNTSNGCTNLLPADAQKLWNYLLIGDPVTFTNTGNPQVTPAYDGYGDWNVPWATWLAGDVLPSG